MFVFKKISEISKEDFTAFMVVASDTYAEYCELEKEYGEYFKDTEYCSDILYDFFKEQYPGFEKDGARGRFYICMADEGTGKEKIIGQITHTKDYLNRDRISYYILPDYRRKGLMGQAYDQFIEDTRQSGGLKNLFAAVNKNNTPSMYFLLSRGFNYVGFEKGCGYDGDDIKPRHVFTRQL